MLGWKACTWHYWLIVHVLESAHTRSCGSKGTTSRSWFSPSTLGSRGWTQDARLSGKYLYLLCLLVSPRGFKILFLSCYLKRYQNWQPAIYCETRWDLFLNSFKNRTKKWSKGSFTFFPRISTEVHLPGLPILILKFSNTFLLLFPMFHTGKPSDTLRGIGEDTCSHLWTIMESQSRGASVGFGVGQAYVQTRPYWLLVWLQKPPEPCLPSKKLGHRLSLGTDTQSK